MTNNNSKRALMLVMGVLVLIGFGIAKLYYDYQDKGIDPRIIEARQLYAKYDIYAEQNNFNAGLLLLDSIEAAYKAIPHYSDSYEIGVLYNNKAAIYLTVALHYGDKGISLNGVNVLHKDSLLNLGMEAVQKSIDIYTHWMGVFASMQEPEIIEYLQNNFLPDFDTYKTKQQQHFLRNRVKELLDAQFETPRRLSVAYTNLGIINRHNEDFESAVANYQKAVELWDKNLTAENNLNLLLGKPLKKQRLIDKIIPPDKQQ